MVVVLIRLKLRMLRNSLRGKQIAAMIAGGVFGLLFAIGTLLLAVIVPGDAADVGNVLAAVYGAWLLGWVLAPLVNGGGDETLRPEQFALLPLPRTKLAGGLLASGLVGVAPMVTLMAFGGIFVFGLRLGPGPAVLGVVFALLQLLLVVLLQRVVMTALSAVLTSRTGKELGIVLVSLLAFSGIGVNYALNSIGPAILAGRAPGVVAAAEILPSGWGVRAVRAAGENDWPTAALLLAAVLGLLGVLLVIWGWLLARQVVTPAFRGTAKVSAARRGRALLPLTPVGAVTRKELKTWWRDTRRRIGLASGLIVCVAIAIAPLAAGGDSGSPLLPYLGVVVVLFTCAQTGNLYGYDGGALWHTLVVPGAARSDVRGRQLAWVLVVAPLALVLAAVLPAVTGRADVYPWVLGMVPLLLGAGAGAVVLQAVFAAFPLPDQRRSSSPWRSGGRPGCAVFLMMIGVMVLLLVSTAPVAGVIITGIVLDLPALEWVGIPVGLLVGGLLAWWWGELAIGRLRRRGPELLATVSKEA